MPGGHVERDDLRLPVRLRYPKRGVPGNSGDLLQAAAKGGHVADPRVQVVFSRKEICPCR